MSRIYDQVMCIHVYIRQEKNTKFIALKDYPFHRKPLKVYVPKFFFLKIITRSCHLCIICILAFREREDGL